MEAIVASVQEVANTTDEAKRKELIDTLNRLATSIESPQDLMQRLLYLHVYIAVARIGCDLQLFNHVASSVTPVTAQEMAQRLNVAPNLIGRILRYLASVGAIEETAPSTYTANAATRTLAEPAWQSAIYHNFDFAWPCFLAMPDFLKETDYKDVKDSTNCPFNKGHQTSEAAFDWYPKQWRLFLKFNEFMTVQRLGMPTWLDKYPYLEKTLDLEPDQALFVDVGGGVGHQSIALREALPADITNKIIVQDQAPLVAQAIRKPGVESMIHDFWKQQPVTGARIYYLRNIIHDWPDHTSVIILQHIKEAMGPDSLLLIDEMVVPEVGAHWQATQLDILMMAALGSHERSETQWKELLLEAGLKIINIVQYTASLHDCIIECVPA